MRLLILLRTLVTYFLIAIAAPFFVIPCLLIMCLPEKYRYGNRLFFWLADSFFKWVVFASFCPMKIEGKMNLPKKHQPVIFAANHQSALDIPVMGILSNKAPHVWFVLEYYINKPVLGFFIKRMFVPVDKSSGTRAARALLKLLKLIEDHKMHLIIFPEGGRFIDDQIHEFYRGFAIVAKKTGNPVIPVYMPNNGKIYPPYSFLIYRYPIKIIVSEPFAYGEGDTEESFTQKVYDWFLKTNKEYHDEQRNKP